MDDYLPTLKYGTQLPAPSRGLSSSTLPVGRTAVTITDVNIPFGSVLKMAFKIFGAWLIVGVCFAPIAIIIWFVILAGIMSFFGHAFSGSHP